MGDRRRLDAELVRRGLCPSAGAARTAVEAGRVTVGGAPASTPGRMVSPHEAVLVLAPPPRFVSRAGEKLEAALEGFDVEVAGRRAVDAGASTGGFTDCLLQRGARSVVALDVGYGQLHQKLRDDPRVHVVERCNLRSLAPPDGDDRRDRLVGAAVPLVVADLSFISLRTVAPAVLALAAPAADLILLVKPQFEAERAEASRGRGIIRDPGVWRRALDGVIAAYADLGACIMGAMVSPVRGAQGNVEFLVHLVPAAPSQALGVDIAEVVRTAASDGSTS